MFFDQGDGVGGFDGPQTHGLRGEKGAVNACQQTPSRAAVARISL